MLNKYSLCSFLPSTVLSPVQGQGELQQALRVKVPVLIEGQAGSDQVNKRWHKIISGDGKSENRTVWQRVSVDGWRFSRKLEKVF